MLSKEKISELRDNARLAIAEEIEDAQIKYSSLTWLFNQMQAWKRWYLKKNQPKNYFRVTRIMPPGTEDRPQLWVQKFQIWVNGKIHAQYDIESSTFEAFYNHPEWCQANQKDMEIAVLRPKT